VCYESCVRGAGGGLLPLSQLDDLRPLRGDRPPLLSIDRLIRVMSRRSGDLFADEDEDE
jgi:hypothetical protein